jgi:trimeric autotransporter adhesin
MNKALAVRWMMLFSLWFSPFMVSAFVFSSFVFAAEGPQTFTIDGRIKQAGTTTPILDSSVEIEVHVMDPSRVCVLYAERQTVNTLSSNGYFNIQVGSITGAGKRVAGVDPGLVMARVFSNAQAMAGTNVSGQTCPAGTYTPLARDQRYFRIFVTPSGTGVRDTLADVQLDAVPTAMVAENAENANSVGGFGPADLLRVRTTGGHVLTQVNLENIFTTSNHTVLLGLLAGTSPLYNRPAANGTTVLPTIAAPSSPSAGQIWYDAGNVYYHDGATTRTISTGGASSGVAAGNGTAAAPSISFSGDTDTGWYLAGADNLAAATGGVERVRINQNGNLGVGSNSPDARLTLGGAMTAPAWTSSGIGIRQNSVTYTDSSSSGVVGFNYVNAFGVPNLAATSATTYTNASAFSLYPPTPGANVTLTNSTGLTVNASALPGVTNGYGVQVNAPTGATNNYAATFMGGNVGVGVLSPATRLEIAGSVKIGDGGETCGAGFAGALRYNGGNLQICNGTAWASVSTAAAGITALTGDVTASGTGSVAATIANDAVTFAKMQNIATDRILGRDSAGSGDVEELSLGTGLAIAGGALTLSDTTDDDSFATLLGVCGNGFVPHRAGGVWTCLEATDANTVSTLVRRDGAGSFIATQATLNNLRLNNAGSFVNISTPVGANYNLTLPIDDGTPSQVLQTDGSGVLTWVTPSSGTGDFLANGTVPMTGAFRAIPGTAAAPGYTFVGDTNNGIYAPAADNVAVTTAGTERLRVTDTGYIGIGTTAPTYPVHVNSAPTLTTTFALTPTSYSNIAPAPTADTGAYYYGSYGSASTSGSFNYTGKLTSVGGTAYHGSPGTLAYLQGAEFGAERTGSGGAVTNLTGSATSASYSGTGTQPSAAGIYGYASNASTGTITEASGGTFNVNNSGGTISSAAAVRTFINNASGAMTNAYGLYIGTPWDPGSGIVNSWGIYQQGGTKNYFAGDVGIGITNPTTKLQVAGTIVVGDGSETCSGGNFAGGIRYNGGNLQFCNGTAWSTLGVAGAGITALTGDVTASGTGSVAATIANDAVTFAKMQNIATQRLIGRSTAAAGDAEELSVGTGLTITGGALNLTDTTDDDSFATLLGVCGNGFVPHRVGGAWTCLEATDANTFSTLVRRDGSGNFIATQATLNTLRLNNAGSFVNISTPATASYSLTLPIDDGAANQVLQTDGSGVLTWVTPASGSGDFLASGTVPMTGAFRAIPGTAAAPGVTFVGDTNNGIYAPAADNVAVTTAGTERLRVTDAGNVGIGTTAPTMAGLEVRTAISNRGLFASGGPTNSGISLGGDATAASMQGFLSGGGDTMILMQNNGAAAARVGIGHATPANVSTRLAVNGTIRVGDGGETCAAGVAGGIRYNGGNLQFCDGTTWASLGVAGAGITALTGDVTASGTGSVAATIANDSVTFAKMQNIATQRLIGRSTAAAGDAEELSVGTGLTITGGALNLTDTTDDDSFATLLGVCGNGFVPHRAGGVWTCLEATDANTLSTLVRRDGAGSFTATQATLNNLRLNNAGSYVNISTPLTANYNLTLPIDDGTANQVLQTDGSGVLTWVTPASGSGDFMANGTVPMTGAFRAADGTAALPGIAFASQPNTGMYRNGADAIAFSTNGINAIQLDLNSVGIYRQILGANAATAGAPQYSFVGDVNTGVFNPAGDTVAVSTAGSERMRIGATGNVGIGTTAPTSMLHVSGGDVTIHNGFVSVSAGASDAYLANSGTAVSPTNYSISIGNNTGGVGAHSLMRVRTRNNLATDQFMVFGGVTTSDSAFSPSFVVAQQTSATTHAERFRIDPSGNVGIGTTAPTVRTHVAGTLRIGDGGELCSAAGAGSLKWNGTDIQFCDGTVWADLGGGGTGDFLADGSVPMTGAFRSIAGTAAAPGVTFVGDTNNGIYAPAADNVAVTTAGTERMRIDASGNVGIGATNPAAPLDIRRDSLAAWTNVDSIIARNEANPAVLNGVGSALAFYGNGNVPMARVSSNWDAGSTNNSQLNFEVRRSGSQFTAMRIFPNGATAIGDVGAGFPNAPRFTVSEPTTAGNTIVTLLNLYHYDQDSAASNGIGTRMTFGAESNAANTYVESAAIASALDDATDTSKDGSLRFQTLGPNAGAGSNTATEKMRIDSSGNVGIGTTSPTRLLHVAGPMRITASTVPASPVAGDIYINSASSNALTYYNGTAWVALTGGGGTGDFMANGTVPMTGAFEAATGTATNPSITFNGDEDTGFWNYAANGISVVTNGAERTRFTSSGLQSTTSNAFALSNGVSAAFPSYTFLNDTDTGTYRPAADTYAITTGGTEKMRVTATGNVGIGTTAPQSALQVTGYVQLDTVTGAPPGTDCDAAAEYGRMKVDPAAGSPRLYVCTADGWTAMNVSNPASGYAYGGANWYLGAIGASCTATCSSVSLSYDTATDSVAGTNGTAVACEALVAHFAPSYFDYSDDPSGANVGCAILSGTSISGLQYGFRDTSGTTAGGAVTGSEPVETVQRICACQ